VLVLARTTRQQIKIGPHTVTVLSIKGKEVRLGFEFDKEIPIRRGELEPRDKPEETEAA
jgi:carbon storage regulator CsrA